MSIFNGLIYFIVDPEKAQKALPYFNKSTNNNYLREFSSDTQENQEAYRRMLMFEDMINDAQRSFSRNLVDLSPLFPMGRADFADEHRNLSSVLPEDMYDNASKTLRHLYGRANPGQESGSNYPGLSRFNTFDRELADHMATQLLNSHLPMDIPEVRQHAIELLRSGEDLDAVSAKTRQWILDKSGTNSLAEFMAKRNDPAWSRLVRVFNSSAPAKFIGASFGTNNINDGYFNEGMYQTTRPAKDAIMYSQLANMIGGKTVIPWLIGGRAGDVSRVLLKAAGGPVGTALAFGSNIGNAYANLRDKDSLKRFMMSEIAHGRDPRKALSSDAFYDVAAATVGLPYQVFTGPGNATKMYHNAKMLIDPEYAARVNNIYDELDSQGFMRGQPSGKWIKGKNGKSKLRTMSATEEFSDNLSNRLLMHAVLGRAYLPYYGAFAAAGAGKGMYDVLNKWNDSKNWVTDTEEIADELARDNPHDSSEAYNAIVQSFRGGARQAGRLLNDPYKALKRTVGVYGDLAKSGYTWLTNRSDRISDRDARKGAVIVRNAESKADRERGLKELRERQRKQGIKIPSRESEK